jgi:adenosylcobinamide kinase/adenosylcobinamide-phosphate guanylyltransferase
MRVLPDGAWLPGEPAAPALRGRTLVLGGARSGKSAAAERLLAAAEKVTYVATAASRDDDAEWVARVATHRARRPATWSTVETADVAEVLRAASGPVLVDCLSLWLAGVLDDIGFWDEAPGADAALAARTDDLLDAWRAARVPVVAVSSEVGSGVVPATAAGRRYRDELGLLNARVAAESEDVLLVVAGRVLPLTGPAPAGPA